MRIFQLVYISRSTAPIDHDLLAVIRDHATRENRHRGVTGMLFATRGHFLQILEGEPAAVAALYDRIEQDPRHADIRLLFFGPTSRRCFGSWSMGVFDLDEPTQHKVAEELWRVLNLSQGEHPGVTHDRLVAACETFRSALEAAA
jgi:hypothetical protein